MAQEVFPHIYRLEIPIPNSPLKSLNSYVITGGKRPLVIDTGLNREECITAMRQHLGSLGIRPEDADYFITHMHADHSGSVGVLAGQASTVYASRQDAQVINHMDVSSGHWDRMKHYAICCGFPEEEATRAIQSHPGYKYGNTVLTRFTEVAEGFVILAGDYELQCLETPGHTQGHVCLYEPHHRVLFSGDHILPGITPNISTWRAGENPLASFIKSLTKVSRYQVDLFLPGHRWGTVDCRVRIEELKRHHHSRNCDILAILQDALLTPFQIASRMRWDLSYTSWDQFPAAQKWFATGEAVAHLQFLESEGKIEQQIIGDSRIGYQRRST